MQDTTLFKIAIVASISGLILLYVALEAEQPKSISASAIQWEQEGAEVLLKGVIQKVINKGNTTIILMAATDATELILFKKPLFNLTEHLQIEARGRVTEYQGEKELVADEVRVI